CHYPLGAGAEVFEHPIYVSSGETHGFLLSGGSFTTVGFPGAFRGTLGTPATAAGCFDAQGVAGFYAEVGFGGDREHPAAAPDGVGAGLAGLAAGEAVGSAGAAVGENRYFAGDEKFDLADETVAAVMAARAAGPAANLVAADTQ